MGHVDDIVDKTAFISRQPCSPEDTTIHSDVICAEKPDIHIIRQVMTSMAQEADALDAPAHAAMQALIALTYVGGEAQRDRFMDKQGFRAAVGEVIETLCETGWEPSPADQDALGKRLIAHSPIGDEPVVRSDNDWRTNLEAQMLDIRLAHLRSIAKKGHDLDGIQHYAKEKLEEGNPDLQARVAAALEVVATGNVRQQAEQLLNEALAGYDDPSQPLTISVARPIKNYEEGVSFNVLTHVFAIQLEKELKQEVVDRGLTEDVIIEPMTVTMVTKNDRTSATPFERLVAQPAFELPEVAGKKVIAIDDHADAGAYLTTMKTQLEAQGGQFIGCATHSRHPTTPHLGLPDHIRDALTNLYPAESYDTLLANVGLSLDSLTGREGLILLAILQGPEQEQAYRGLMQQTVSAEYSDVLPGIKSDVMDILRQPAMTLAELQTQMVQESTQMR